MVKALKDKDIPVAYLLYPDEGHGFARPENNIAFRGLYRPHPQGREPTSSQPVFLRPTPLRITALRAGLEPFGWAIGSNGLIIFAIMAAAFWSATEIFVMSSTLRRRYFCPRAMRERMT
jgi:hypothetical protein